MAITGPINNLASYVVDFAQRYPDHTALVSPTGGTCSYSKLSSIAGTQADFILSQNIERLGLLADRTIGAYTGVVAAAWAGIAYVPFSLKAPPKRLCDQLELSKISAVLIDENGLKSLTPDMISVLPKVVLATSPDVQKGLLEAGVKATFLETSQQQSDPVALSGDEEAYIIFTSGSSGVPKGVLISTRARDAFFKSCHRHFEVTMEDRVAQPSDLAWDVSVESTAYAFRNGATLYLMSANNCFSPANFIRKNKITLWDGVPTTAEIMSERGELTPNTFPDMRITIFGGAALSLPTLKAWKRACPNATILNSYGPTEMTAACIDYVIPEDFDSDRVPLGTLFPDTQAMIVGEGDKELPDNEAGELWLAGIQQANGYLDDPIKTQESFVSKKDKNGEVVRWYKTGDLAYRGEDGLFYFKGRADHQLKIMGYRIELEEIEAHLKKSLNMEHIAVLGYPIGESNVDDLITFIELSPKQAAAISSTEIMENMLKLMPLYMVPRTFYAIEEFPRLANGKLDRKKLPDLMDDSKLI